MTNGPLVCDVCQEPGQNLRRLQDVGLIEVAQGLNFQAEYNLCDLCYRMIERRYNNIGRPGSEVMGSSQTVETIDISLNPTQQSSQHTQIRLSEMPLPSSPLRSTSSSSGSSSAPLDDTVDRLVSKKPRFDARVVQEAIGSQSLSFSGQSPSVSKSKTTRQSAATPSQDNRAITTLHQSDDSSLDEPQLPPLPKARRMRPGPKQFATGVLELPLNVKSKILSSDFPRVLAG